MKIKIRAMEGSLGRVQTHPWQGAAPGLSMTPPLIHNLPCQGARVHVVILAGGFGRHLASQLEAGWQQSTASSHTKDMVKGLRKSLLRGTPGSLRVNPALVPLHNRKALE